MKFIDTHKHPDAVLEEVERIVERIKPLLAGKPPNVQGLILADLTALWISHHLVATAKQDEQIALWGEILKMHTDKVWDLIVLYGEAHEQ